jgi:DNA excision repair protein ERCC-2
LKNGGGMGRKEIEEQAEKFQVCPFEFALDLSVWADGIICDYNYVFDPNAHLKRFFADGGNNHYLFLVDEAHNLVERGREMYSASLYKEDVLEVKRIVKGKDKKLTRSLESMNKAFLELKRECENYQILDSVSVLALKAMNLLTEMERYLEEQREQGRQDGTEEEILPLFFGLRSFLNIHDLLDKNYVIYSEMQSDGRFMVKLFCVNPAENLQKCLEQGNSTIFFSATLLPIQYYKSLLSVVQDDYAVYAESTFPETNRSVLLAEGISTKYTSRGEEMYSRIAEYIGKTIDSKTGNYMAFFPSYRLMEAVYEKFLELGKKSEVLLQSQYMDEEEREEFLKKFEKEQDGTLVAFCVMGGIFSEGIDLTQDRLIGAMIVGTGIPQVCNEREILKQYFGAEGFDYAYLYPGMNKVLQSAGRVIRTEKDKGVILLMDERFQSPHYRKMFPREWSDCRRCTMENVTELLTEFWKKDPT